MSANRIPTYPDAPKCWQVQISTANTARDGSGTIGTLVTAGSNGTRITSLAFKATSTTAAGLINIFLHDGSNYRFYSSIAVSAVGTVNATTDSEDGTWAAPGNGLDLPSGWSLRVATTIAQELNVFAFGGDF